MSTKTSKLQNKSSVSMYQSDVDKLQRIRAHLAGNGAHGHQLSDSRILRTGLELYYAALFPEVKS